MLDSMRGSGNSKTMWVIIGLLMLGLTGFGIGGLGGGTIRTIGSVGDEPIPIATYARGMQNAMATLNQQAGRILSPAEIEATGVQGQVLDAVVGLAALNNEVTQKGLSVGDDAVRETIVGNPQFRGANGSFDRAGYEFYLERQLGISVAEYEELLRKENARSILETAIVGGIESPGTASRAVLDFALQERSMDWAELTADLLPEPVADPTDDQLRAFYDANADDYRTLRTRNITYVWLNPSDLSEQVDVSDAELQDSYDAQADRFQKPEQRAVDRLVFSDAEAAAEARRRLDAGDVTFSALIAERRLGETDISMGEVERGDLSDEADAAVFAAEGPGIVGPVESALGPALFRINALLAEDVTTLEEATDELRDELAGEKARRLVNDLVTEIDDLLAGGATLEELGRDTAMVLGTVALNADATDTIVGYEAFRQAAEAAQEGDFPELVDLDDGGVFALRLDGIDEPAPIPLEEIRARVSADWKAEQTLAALRALATGYVAEIAQGTEPEALIWNVEETLTRASFVDNLPPTTVSELFRLEAPDDIAIVDDADRVVLARLTDITPFDAEGEEAAAALDRLKRQREAQVALDMLDLFSRAVQDRSQVSLNRSAINQVNSQLMGLR